MNNRNWEPDRIQCCIDHIKTAMDVDPWAKELAEELLTACLQGKIQAVRCKERWKRGFGGDIMSKMIQCDSCKKLFVDDSTSKGKIHELWIDHETGFHACDECLLKMLKEYFPEVYDWEMSSRED